MKPSLPTLAAGLLTLAVTLLPTLSFADEKGQCPKGGPGAGGPRISPEDRVARMTEHLGLTNEQAAALTEVFEGTRSKIEAFRESGQRPDPTVMKKLRDETKAAVDDILTTEQKAKLEAKLEALREKMGKGGPGNGPRQKRGQSNAS